ncbi:MAG: hypothetical protein ABI873_13835 [Marmoricola sp.]
MRITDAELFQSAARWGFLAKLSDPTRRREYQGAWRLGFQVETIVGPALFTYLAINWGTPGWLLIAGIAALAAVIAHPAARSAEGYLRAGPPAGSGAPTAVPKMAP